MKHIPNFITCLNLAAGFAASILAANGDLLTASWLIVAAMIFDFLDGFSARLLKAWSDTGKELDSLADVISFGAAPAMIVYKLIYNSSVHPVISYIAILMPVCAALRLAKFNTDPAQVSSFRGLPTPANAIGVISVVAASEYSHMPVPDMISGTPWVLTSYSILLSLLMVTRIPLMSLKVKNLRFSGNEGRFVLLGLIVISFILFGSASTLLIVPFYILVSLGEKAIKNS
jgi:CDP-diacylglycerol--serine O-phosphatidyltransferase